MKLSGMGYTATWSSLGIKCLMHSGAADLQEVGELGVAVGDVGLLGGQG